MRVIHVVESFGGGTIHFVRHLAEQMTDWEHTVVHAIRQDEDYEAIRRQFPAGTTFILWPSAQREISPRKDFAALRELASILRKTQAHVIHLHSSKAGFLGRAAALWLGKRNVVYTSHAAAFLQKGVSQLRGSAYRLFERLGAWMGGVVVSCSVSEQKAFAEIGIDSRVIENGVETPNSMPERMWDANPLVGVVTGRISQQKGPERMKAIAGMIKTQPIRLVWIGDGPQAEELRNAGLEVTGWLPPDEVRQRLYSAHFYISTSEWEGMSLGALEGMASGLPLLLSRCTGNVDLIQDEKNGYLYDTPEGAVRVMNLWLRDRQLMASQGLASGLICASQFSINRVAAQYRALYLNLAKKHTVPPTA